MRSSIPQFLENLTRNLLCGGILALIVVSKNACALTYDREKVKSAMENAALVAEIEVEQLAHEPDAKFGVRFRATSRLLSVIRTADRDSTLRAGDRIVIAGLGGELASTGVYLTGFPRPHQGKQYRVVLNPGAVAGEFTVVGFENGFKPLGSARAYSRNRTDGSNGDGTGPFLYWDDSFFPIPYYISASTFGRHADFLLAIDTALNTWRKVDSTRYEFLPMGCTEGSGTGNDGLNQIVFISRGWELDPLAIAVTRNYYISGNSARTGLIMDSDILLNGQAYNFTTTNAPGSHDVQNILTHETGHLMGLGHEIDPIDTDASMYAWAGPNEVNKRNLHPNDVAAIREAYGGTGNRFPGDIATTNCALGKGGSCLVVHGKPAPGPRGWALAAGLLVTILGLGRWYQRRRITSAS